MKATAPSAPRAPAGARHPADGRRRAPPRRRPGAGAIRVACAGGLEDRCSRSAGVRGRADRRSIRQRPAELLRTAAAHTRHADSVVCVRLAPMKVLVVGAGGVGAAFAAIAQRRPAFEHVVLADVALDRARAAARRLAEPDRFHAERVDATSREQLLELIRRTGPDAVLNACDPRFNEPIFDAAFEARVTYLDMAMTLSHPHPERPHELPGQMLGDRQLARHEQWQSAGLLALVGIGVEPGLSDVLARYAADELFYSVREIGVRDGADLVVEGHDFAPTFSIWTTIEECLNPPLVWEKERGFYTTEPFSEPELFEFPEGIGVTECVNVEHEEVVLVPREIDCRRVTFKYGLGAEFIDVLQTLHKLGLDSTDPVRVRGVDVAPRDVVAAVLPDPATLGDRMRGKTCAGTLVTGKRKDGGDGAA